MNKILCTICARGGSKGLKNKNIKELNGKPLIAYTVKQALEWGKADRVICSTDSKEIAEIAKKYGAIVPFMRPKKLATDHSGKLPTIKHATLKCEEIFEEQYDIIVDLDITGPIRTVEDIDNCLKIFLEKRPEVLFSVVNARRNPYFNLVEKKENGFVKLSKSLPNPVVTRQEAPKVYDVIASIYFYSKNFLLNEKIRNVASSDKATSYIMDDIAGVDIDTESDFKYIEFLIKEGIVDI